MAGIGPLLHLGIREGRSGPPAAEPGEQPFVQFRPDGGMFGPGPQVEQLAGIRRKIEELRPVTLPEHILPIAGAHHVAPGLLHAATKREARPSKCVVGLREYGVPRRRRAAPQMGQEGSALDAVGLRFASGRVKECRRQIDRLHEIVDNGRSRSGGVADDQRDADALLVQELLFPEPMVAEIIAVVAGEDHEGVVQPPLFHEEGEQPAHMVVDLPYQAHIDGDDRTADLVPGEALAVPVSHERRMDGMRILPFPLVAVDRADVVRAVDRMVGGRRDIGPVRLYVGEMQAPLPFPLASDEVHRTVGHVGGLGMLGRHPRRQRGMAHVPAGERLAVGTLRGVGEVMPRVGTVVAEGAQPSVVGQIRVGNGIGMQAVIPFDGVEAALAQADADVARRVDSEARHAAPIRSHVRLADKGGVKAQRLQIVGQREFADGERDVVPGRAVAEHVPSRIEGHSGRAADRRLAVCPREPNALGRQGVQVGCSDGRMAVAGQVIRPQLVGHDEQDVADFSHAGASVLHLGRYPRTRGNACPGPSDPPDGSFVAMPQAIPQCPDGSPRPGIASRFLPLHMDAR